MSVGTYRQTEFNTVYKKPMKLPQYSIATLMLAMLAVAIVAFLFSDIHLGVRADDPQSAQNIRVSVVMHAVGGGEKSIVGTIDRDGPNNVYGLSPDSITDETMVELANLRWTLIKHLNIQNRPITDKGLRAIEDYPYLHSLDVSGTQITDASLDVIGNFTMLEKLDLSNTTITDENLAALNKLESLRMIHIGNTKITERGIKSLLSYFPAIVIQTKAEMAAWQNEE